MPKQTKVQQEPETAAALALADSAPDANTGTVVDADNTPPLAYAKNLNAEQRQDLLDRANQARDYDQEMAHGGMKLIKLFVVTKNKYGKEIFNGWLREEVQWTPDYVTRYQHLIDFVAAGHTLPPGTPMSVALEIASPNMPPELVKKYTSGDAPVPSQRAIQTEKQAILHPEAALEKEVAKKQRKVATLEKQAAKRQGTSPEANGHTPAREPAVPDASANAFATWQSLMSQLSGVMRALTDDVVHAYTASTDDKDGIASWSAVLAGHRDRIDAMRGLLHDGAYRPVVEPAEEAILQ